MFSSSVFSGTLSGKLFSIGHKFTSTGEPIYTPIGSIRFNAISVDSKSQETSIRTDKSGSKSRAVETEYPATIQVEPTKIGKMITVGQRIDMSGAKYRVIDVKPVYTVMDAILDHILVGLEIWP